MGSNKTTTPALAEQPLPRFLSLVPEHAKRLDPRLRNYAGLALAQADEKLRAATPDDFRRELTACLTLVAPTGMTEVDRQEWLTAAWATLNGIPADLLAMGAGVARRWSDHPSKIVPAILREVEPIWNQRKADRSRVLSAIAKMEPEPDNEPRCTPEEAERIRKECGIVYEDERSSTMFTGSDEMRQRMRELEQSPPSQDMAA